MYKNGAGFREKLEQEGGQCLCNLLFESTASSPGPPRTLGHAGKMEGASASYGLSGGASGVVFVKL